MELVLDQLTKQYGSLTALDSVSFSFHEGIYGILGANGAGKSTLMKLITDNTARTGGRITFDGEDILEMGDRFRSVLGYMPQQQGVYERMSVYGFISYIARLKGLRGRNLRNAVETVLGLTNLSDIRHKAAGTLSGGMRQRLLLSQALLGDPKVLLLDEPTAGLDPKERLRIREYIKNLSKDRIVLLATHIVTDIETIADQVLLMQKGRILRADTPGALIEAVPADWIPITGRTSLEDVYLYFLGE